MADQAQNSSRLLAYLQLMRLPNVFTAMADIFIGYWITHESLSPTWIFILLLVSASCLYTAGMVLNDVFDFEQDLRERPTRPLPSGRIARHSAMVLGNNLLVAGLFAAFLTKDKNSTDWRLLFVLAGLAGSIFLYDRYLKRTPLGPIAMGCCRFFNVLLGMSATAAAWNTANWAVAAGIGIYVTGVTWFARREATTSGRPQLIGGLLVMLAGMGLLWGVRLTTGNAMIDAMMIHQFYWIMLWVTVVALIGWRFVRAIVRPEPALVQAAVKSGILSIIVLDASVVFAVRGLWPAVAVLLLLAPAVALGRWVYST